MTVSTARLTCPICRNKIPGPENAGQSFKCDECAGQLITFVCVNCARRLAVKAEFAGKEGKCRGCGTKQTVPLQATLDYDTPPAEKQDKPQSRTLVFTGLAFSALLVLMVSLLGILWACGVLRSTNSQPEPVAQTPVHKTLDLSEGLNPSSEEARNKEVREDIRKEQIRREEADRARQLTRIEEERKIEQARLQEEEKQKEQARLKAEQEQKRQARRQEIVEQLRTLPEREQSEINSLLVSIGKIKAYIVELEQHLDRLKSKIAELQFEAALGQMYGQSGSKKADPWKEQQVKYQAELNRYQEGLRQAEEQLKAAQVRYSQERNRLLAELNE